MTQLPLQGVRILDVTAYLAGPYAITFLATMGAEVIKIEAIQRLDYVRLLGGFPQPDGYDWSPGYNSINLNKYAITLNLNHNRGRDIFKKLVETSDVVAQNFTPRVMENWGLSYDEVKKINPRIIMLSMPGLGNTGPWRDYVMFGPNVEMLAGIPLISGYRTGTPRMNGYTSDPFASLMGATSIMVALKHRQRTGKGQFIDLSQVEAVTTFMGELIMDYTMNKRLQPRRGNRHAHLAPQGVYRCKGEDEWVAITVTSDEKWTSLCDAMGQSALASDSSFSSARSRHEKHDEIDKLIEGWTRQHDKYEVARLLQQVGVASAPVLSGQEVVDAEHLKERGFFEAVAHPKIGTHTYAGFPVKFSKTPVRHRMPSPTFGQHNHYVLTKLLGITEEEIAQLTKEQVIGTRPLGWPYAEEGGDKADEKLRVLDSGTGVIKMAMEKMGGTDAKEGEKYQVEGQQTENMQ